MRLAVALDELHVEKIAEAIGSPARFFLGLFARPGPAADLPGRKPRCRAAAQKVQDLLLLGIQHEQGIDRNRLRLSLLKTNGQHRIFLRDFPPKPITLRA